MALVFAVSIGAAPSPMLASTRHSITCARFARAESREGRSGTRAWRLAEHRESRSVIAREAHLKRSCGLNVTEAPSAAAPHAAPDGIHKIKHVVIVMQDNRSFDSYFGTFPGVDGLPRDSHGNFTTCTPDPN